MRSVLKCRIGGVQSLNSSGAAATLTLPLPSMSTAVAAHPHPRSLSIYRHTQTHTMRPATLNGAKLMSGSAAISTMVRRSFHASRSIASPAASATSHHRHPHSRRRAHHHQHQQHSQPSQRSRQPRYQSSTQQPNSHDPTRRNAHTPSSASPLPPTASAAASIPSRSTRSGAQSDAFAKVRSLLSAGLSGDVASLPKEFLPPSITGELVPALTQRRRRPSVTQPASPSRAATQQLRPERAELNTVQSTTVTPTSAAPSPSTTPSEASTHNAPNHMATVNPFAPQPISLRTTYSLEDDIAESIAQQQSLVQPEDPHALNIVILGTPNAGKSTLVNRLVGQKISAVSHKRNTTRTSVLGVASRDNRQIVLFDTPGVLPSSQANKYQREISTAAWDAASGADMAIVIIDVVKHLSEAEYELLKKARSLLAAEPDMKLILLLNKMDLCKPKKKAENVANILNSLAPFQQTFMCSLIKEKGVTEFEEFLYASSVPREWDYPVSQRTDQSRVELVNEIIREKVFLRVHEEIPYRVEVRNTGWTVLRDGHVRIDVTLQVETKHQKSILVGILNQIKSRALPEIQQLLNTTVWLFLKVTTAKN